MFCLLMSKLENSINNLAVSRLPANVGDDFRGCVQTGLVVSEVFCLPPTYRREVPPPSE